MTDASMRFRDDSHDEVKPPEPLEELPSGKQVFHSWLPWIILCVVLAFWASPFWKALGNKLFDPVYHVPGLDKLILAVPPVVTKAIPQAGVLSWQILTYSGTGVLVSGIIAGLIMGFSPVQLVRNWLKTIYIVRFPLIAIVLMLSLATLTGTSGITSSMRRLTWR